MRLRGHSQLGWGLLQMLGEVSLPHVTKEAQQQAEANAGRRVLLAGRGRGMTEGLSLTAVQQAALDGPHFTQIFYRCGHPYRTYRTAKPLRRTLDHDCGECSKPAPPPEPPPPEPHAQPPGGTVEDEFCTKLEACHCASPEQAMGEMRYALELVSRLRGGELPMLVLYYLDARELIEHGSTLHGCWLNDDGQALLDWLRAKGVGPQPIGDEYKSRWETECARTVEALERQIDAERKYASLLRELQSTEECKRCACSRLVPASEWVEPHGCCPDCEWKYDGDWRAEVIATDRERLISEVVD